MAAGDKVSKVILEYEIQKQKLAELRAANAAVLQDVNALGFGTAKAGDRAREFGQALQDQRERLNATRQDSANLRAGILNLDTSLQDASDGSVSLAGNLAKVRDEIQKTKDAADQAGPSVDNLTGDGGSSGGGGVNGAAGLKRGGEVFSRLGFGETGRGLSTVGDLANVDKFKQELSSLSPTVLAAGVGVGALTIALDLYTKQQELARQAALKEIDARQKAITLATTGTQEEIQAELNRLAKQKEINQVIANDANALYANLQLEVSRQQGDAALGLEVLAAEAGKAAGQFQAAHDAADTANKALGSTSTEMDILTQATGKTAQSAAEAAVAEQQLADVRKKLSTFSENASDLKQILDLEATGSSVDEVQKLSDAKRRDIKVNEIYEKASNDLANTLDKNSQGYKDAIAEANKYHDAIERDRNFIARLSESTYELVGARQKEAETLDATKKFNDESAKAEADYLQKRADIEQKNADKIIELAQKKADAEEAALAKLVDRVASLNLSAQRAAEDASTKLERQQTDAQVKFQTQQAKDARDHANKLIQIQKDANAKAEDLIAARDFSGLFRLRRDTNVQVQQENDRYSQQSQDQIDAFNQQRDDQLKQYAREAQDRQTKYNRDVQDANTQYAKELTAARNNYYKALNLQAQAAQQELQALADKNTAAANLRQQGITDELKQIGLGNLAKLQLQQQLADQLLAQAAQYLNGDFSSLTNANLGAAGSSLLAGIGSISNSNSIGSMNFNINGNNPVGIGNVVRKIVREQMQYYTG